MGPSGSGKTSLLTVLGGRSAMKYKGTGGQEDCSVLHEYNMMLLALFECADIRTILRHQF